MPLTDAEIGSIVRDYVMGSDHPDLVVYRADFGTKFDMDRWLMTIRQRCEAGAFYNKRILEVGCGFGWDAVGLTLIGGNSVTATDILPSMIDGTRECLDALAKKGRKLNVTPMVGDICKLDLPSGSFDGIFSSEAIEHVHDLKAMFANCYRMLAPGGRFLIVNDSNQFNSEFREDTFKMWKERDESWEHAAWLASDIRPVEHKDAKPYAAMRAAIIDAAHGDLPEADRQALTAATAGMIAPEIRDACAAFRQSGTLPVRPKFSWCRNPETGEYAERLLNPFELRDWLSEAGFIDVKLRHNFNRFPLTLFNNISFRPLNERLFDLRGIFTLTADKRG